MGVAELLEVRPGVTAVIGGGGKTTLLGVLGGELRERGPVLLCTTTKILPVPGLPLGRTLEELRDLAGDYGVVCGGSPLPGGAKLGPLAESMAALAESFAYVLVEADGSAQRPLKAHAPHEPVVPAEANQTICVVGASGFGQPISQAAHRPERYGALAGTPLSAAATPETEAAVLLAEGLHRRLFINQAESRERLEMARRLAELVQCPSVAGSLRKGVYERCWL